MAGELYGFQALREIIPCVPSMVLADKVFVESDTHFIGQKNITMDELVFLGHFPAHPIFPGVLVVEAIAQVAEAGLWKKLDPERKGDFYIKELHKVKFRRPNNPGDRLLIDVTITSMGSDSAAFKAVVTNNGGVSCNAEGTLAVRPKVTAVSPIFTFNEYDKSETSKMDVRGVMDLIPHRYPFLFVDYVAKVDGCHVTGMKNTTGSEPIFRTYKDNYSVMMSAVQAEIAAQAGAVIMLSNEAVRGKIAYFMGIEKSECFFPIFPGDQLRLEVEMPECKKFGRGHGRVFVGDQVASDTTMLFAIVDP